MARLYPALSPMLFAVGMTVMCGTAPLPAQIAGDGAPSVTGSLMLTGDFYDAGSTPAGGIDPRRPASLVRMILTPTASIGELSIPFTVVVSTGQTNVTTPRSSGQSFTQFLLNPMNYVSASPTYRWARLDLGSQVPRYSELSIGDLQLFGVGFDVAPGKLHASGVAGIAQRAIEPDSAAFVRGAYRRTVYAASLGYGVRATSTVDLHVVHTVDDTESVARPPVGITPQEGTLVSLSALATIVEGVSLRGEVAASGFTRNTGSPELDADVLAFLDPAITVRQSTRFDGAAVVTATLDQQDWGLSATARYIGGGFNAIGYQFLQPDRLEFIAGPRVRLLDGALSVSGTIGHRTNNLLGTSTETSRQLIGSAFVFAQATEAFSIAASYSNYGVRTDASSDTARVHIVSQSVSLTPTLAIEGDAARHTITGTLAFDDFDDRNIVTGAVNSNRTISVSGGYMLAFLSIPLSCDLSYSNFHNDLSLGPVTSQVLQARASYRLMDDRLTPSLNVSLGLNSAGSAGTDTQVSLRGACSYRITPSMTAGLAASIHSYRRGPLHPGSSFSETFLQTSIELQL